MLIEIRYTDKGGILHAGGKDPIHGVKLGPKTLIPRNFNFEFQSILDAGSGQVTGKRQHNPFVITKETDSSSPPLFQRCAAGEVIPKITLNFWNTNAQGKPESVTYTITLTNATVASVKRYNPSRNISHASSHSNELEEFQFSFQKITFTDTFKSKSTSDDWLSG